MSKQKLACKILRFTALVIIAIAFLNVSACSKGPSDNNTKIFLIGIDGLEWSIINELIKDGKMPTFDKLMENGSYGDLWTLLEFTSPSLWTTIATGRMPEAHGITSHMIHEEGQYGLVTPKSYHRKVKALWNILTEYRKKVGVINYQCTESPETVNGFILPNIKDEYSNDLTEEINLALEASAKTAKKFFGDFDFYCNYNDELSKEIKYHLADGEIWRLSIITPYLYHKFNKDLDLLMVYLYETDYISHKFWKFMRPDIFHHRAWGLTSENTERFGDVIRDMYVMVDKFVKRLIEDVADENTVIIICSDHGFRSSPHCQEDGTVIPQVIFKDLNKLLEKLGYLQYKTDDKLTISSIDFNKTLAYHHLAGGLTDFPDAFISLNLKGRQSNGIIEPEQEYAGLKKELIDALLNLRIVESSGSLFEDVVESTLEQTDIKIITKFDVELPEQHVEINGDVYPLSNFYVFLDKSGDHSDPGVFIITGKNIQKGEIIKSAHILNITPTILYLLGLPVAKDMQGKVLIQAIDANFLKRNPIRYIDTYETLGESIGKKTESRLIDEQELEKLRSLGYVH